MERAPHASEANREPSRSKPEAGAIGPTDSPVSELNPPGSPHVLMQRLRMPMTGRGGDPARQAAIRQMQQTHGNRAVGRMLMGQPDATPPAPLQRDPFDVKARLEQRGRPKDEYKAMGRAGKEHRATAREKARKADRARLSDQKRIERPEYPSFRFTVEDQQEGIQEHHRIFVGEVNGGFHLMIASYPLPVAAFILEMRQRFDYLVGEGNAANKKPRGWATVGNPYTVVETTANNQLAAANLVFANVGSSADQKLAAEQLLAGALDPVIKKVIQLAKRLGQHFSIPGNASPAINIKITSPLTNAPDPSYYTTELSGAAERYRVEGMVAHYRNLPDYEGSGFERDHQPHNDLIETVATLPEFAGKRIQTVAAGRTQQGWAIMLQHNRHAAGRTFGIQGGVVTNQFLVDLAAKRLALGAGSTPAAIRQFCIDYLVQSMKDDVAALKAVAADDNNYTDMSGMTPGDKTTHKARVKTQIATGEDQILATEASIRTYDQ